MPCIKINKGFVCISGTHKIGDYIVEFPPTGAPVAIKPDGEIYERIPGGRNKFYRVVENWQKKQKGKK